MELLLEYTPHVLTAAVSLLGIVLWPAILLSRKQPAAMMAWLLAVTFVPAVGPLFFLVFGWHRRLPGLPRKKVRADKAIGPYLDLHIDATPDLATHLKGVPESLRTALAVSEAVGRHPLTSGNGLRLCPSGAAMYEALLRDIHAAAHHVHLQYYLLRADGFGNRLAQVLAGKAAQGVEARLLIDGVGSLWLSRAYIARLRAAGVRFEWFHPLNPFRRRWSLNLRNHRKLAVIDGRIGYVGGINLGDEYLGQDPSSGEWHDVAVRMEGPAVHSLQRVFSEDWHFSTGELLSGAAYFPLAEPAPDGALVQVVDSMASDELITEMHQIYFTSLASARRRAWLMTPYFIPDETIQAALASLALGGADVRVLVTHRIQEPLVRIASRSFFPPLLETGVRIFSYRPDETLHAKALLIDDELAIVGSANLDQRSFRINFETGALICDKNFARSLEACFRAEMAQSREVTLEEMRRRTLGTRAVEAVARLAAPLF